MLLMCQSSNENGVLHQKAVFPVGKKLQFSRLVRYIDACPTESVMENTSGQFPCLILNDQSFLTC